MNTRKLEELYAIRDDYVIRVVGIAEEAHRLGLHETGHLLHDAVRKLGWELERKITAAVKEGERQGPR
jgi:hypothetical protein